MQPGILPKIQCGLPVAGARRASADSSMFYGSKCRERCRRKNSCRRSAGSNAIPSGLPTNCSLRPRCVNHGWRQGFYTAYSSGWCQLSSRCSLVAHLSFWTLPSVSTCCVLATLKVTAPLFLEMLSVLLMIENLHDLVYTIPKMRAFCAHKVMQEVYHQQYV